MIHFEPLQESHFPLLLKWLETPHVKAWWDQNIHWTPELIAKLYAHYVKGYKRLTLPDRVVEKPMHAYIIIYNDYAIGYIQYYNKHDFPPEQGYSTADLPKSLAALDFYIADVEYLGKGLGGSSLKLFLHDYVFVEFDACFVDPDTDNTHGIRTYEKAGFKIFKSDEKITYMIVGKNEL